MTTSFQRAYPPARPEPGPAYWLPFREHELLVQEHETGISLILSDGASIAPLKPDAPLYIGTLNAIPCLACEISAERPIPVGWRALGVRALFSHLDASAYSVVGYALQILYWQQQSRYCPTCGRPLGEPSEQWARHCTNCSYTGYPPVSPAIVVLVHDGQRILLTHRPGWGSLYGVIAGFVEPGESLEECVRREVAEEAGIEISDLTYVGSQPWPFPHQLMVGYLARYAGGEVSADQQELDDAAWFSIDDLPELPPPASLGRQIIDTWIYNYQGKS